MSVSATYSNFENHPRLISARQAKSVPRIQLDRKTGLPTVDGQIYPTRNGKGKQIDIIEEENEEDDEDRRALHPQIFRHSPHLVLLSYAANRHS